MSFIGHDALDCDELKSACHATCSGQTRCNIDCDSICSTQDVDATHCQYDDETHGCNYVPCNDGSCQESGSSQPTYSDCLAYCEDASSPARAEDVVRRLVILNCARTGSPECGGGGLEDQRDCVFVEATGECHAVTCPSDPEESCSSVGSSQPTNAACFAHCAANE
jgi:hypothetical protein